MMISLSSAIADMYIVILIVTCRLLYSQSHEDMSVLKREQNARIDAMIARNA